MAGPGARVFRLPGIYGPGTQHARPVREGKAHRIDLPGQVFSRVHVSDIASGVIAGLDAPPGAYNLADDLPCSQNAVIEEACRLAGLPVPPLQSLDEAGLSPAARAFYAENRRVANGKASGCSVGDRATRRTARGYGRRFYRAMTTSPRARPVRPCAWRGDGRVQADKPEIGPRHCGRNPD
jgi:nucleoside-diphosphate-sugar epimerase